MADIILQSAAGGSLALTVDPTLATDEVLVMSQRNIECGEFTGTEANPATTMYEKYPCGRLVITARIYADTGSSSAIGYSEYVIPVHLPQFISVDEKDLLILAAFSSNPTNTSSYSISAFYHSATSVFKTAAITAASSSSHRYATIQIKGRWKV